MKKDFGYILFIFIFTHNQLEVTHSQVEIKIVKKEAATKEGSSD